MSVRQVTLFECDECHKKSEKPDEIRSWSVAPVVAPRRIGLGGKEPEAELGTASTFDACSPGCAQKRFKEIADLAYTRVLAAE